MLGGGCRPSPVTSSEPDPCQALGPLGPQTHVDLRALRANRKVLTTSWLCVCLWGQIGLGVNPALPLTAGCLSINLSSRVAGSIRDHACHGISAYLLMIISFHAASQQTGPRARPWTHKDICKVV